MIEENIIKFKKYIENKNIRNCFYSSIFFGILSYLYIFTNNINNYDNIAVTPGGYGTGTSSGRWFLSELGDFIGEIWGNYNIPIFNGIISLILLAIASCLLIEIFEVKNKWLSILIGAITIVFPPIASTMLFSYTVGYYMLAIFFIMLGILFVKNGKLLGFIFGGFLFSCSLGIYQAYYPLCASIFLLLLIKMCLDTNYDYKKIIKTGFKFLFSLILGYILYSLFLKYCLYKDNIQLSTYQGINEMGKINIKLLPAQIKEIYNSIIKLTYENYCSINATKIVQLSFLLLYIIIFTILLLNIIECIRNKQSIIKIILLLIFILLLPISINFILIMTPNGIVYTLMQMGFVSIFYFAIILSDNLDTFNFTKNISKILLYKIKINKVLLFSTISIIFLVATNYVWQTNGNYRALYYTNKQIENYYQTLLTRIKSIDGYKKEMDICFVGKNINDEKFYNFKWDNTPFKYGGNSYNLNSYSRSAVIENYFAYSYTQVEIYSNEYNKYKNDIEQMDKYPNSNSIKIIDNKIFVRFE